MKNLLDIKYWIFDLDNTLYSGQTKVFSEVDKKMSTFISKKMDVDLVKAKEIQKKLWFVLSTTCCLDQKSSALCLINFSFSN